MEFRVVIKDNHSLMYKLLYSDDCFNVKINVNRENEVIVRAHPNMKFDYVDSVVLKYFDKLYKYIDKHQAFAIFSVDNNYMYLLGVKYEIHVEKTGRRSKYEIYDNRIYLFINDESKKLTMIKKIYHEKAKLFLIERARTLAKQHGFSCDFDTRWYTGRWGQCASNSKQITFADSLIAFEQDVIDYVIYHELCHLTIPNHSAEFWATVGKYYPNYKWAQKKLKFQC